MLFPDSLQETQSFLGLVWALSYGAFPGVHCWPRLSRSLTEWAGWVKRAVNLFPSCFENFGFVAPFFVSCPEQVRPDFDSEELQSVWEDAIDISLHSAAFCAARVVFPDRAPSWFPSCLLKYLVLLVADCHCLGHVCCQHDFVSFESKSGATWPEPGSLFLPSG